MSGDYGIPTVVIDGGSTVFKAGFAGDEFPRSVFPSIVGRPRYQRVLPRVKNREYFIGDEAQRMRGVLALHYPSKHGMITTEDDVQKLYSHVFDNELKVDPREHPLLLTEPALNPKKQPEFLTEEVLSVYSAGLVTGAVLYSGGGVTTSVPVYEGYTIASSMLRLNLGGSDITDYLIRILARKGLYFKTTAEVEIVRDIKEKLCLLAPSHEDATVSAKYNSDRRKIFYLPDEQVITIDDERFLCPEMLFTPSVAGIEAQGVHEMVHQSILKSDLHLHKQLFNNVVVSGGNTMFLGFRDRLRSELLSMVSANVKIKIIAPPERKYTVWIGGSILGSLTSLQHMSIKREEYNECGPWIVHKKCFGFMNLISHGHGDYPHYWRK